MGKIRISILITRFMDSYTSLFIGVGFSIVVTTIVYLLGDLLRTNFPPLPVWRGVLWYRWKSLPSKEALTFSPFTGIHFPYNLKIRAKSAWLCFFLHLIFVFSMIIWAELRYSDPKGHNCPNPASPDWCGWSPHLELPHYVFLAGTAFFMVLHIVQTHLKYDGIAQDTAELCPIIGTVLALVVLALMQQTERGLVFGYGLTSDTFVTLTNIARRFHPYVLGWDIVFTFWYHPMEGGLHHVPGFLPLLLILVQGCLLFTTAHLNPVWRIALELFGFPHAIYVEYSHPERKRWKMLLTGVLITPLVVHFHIFHISIPVMVGLLLGYLLLVVMLYKDMPLICWSEPLHFPLAIFSLIFLIYGTIYIPYKLTNLFGIWTESAVKGTIPAGFDLGVWICGTFLVLATVVLTFVLADIFEALLRAYARRVGPATDAVNKVFRMSSADESRGSTNGTPQDSGTDPNEEGLKRREAVSDHTNKLTISLKDLNAHDNEKNAWIAINGIVYDVTEFLSFHPGGKAILLEQCGKDATKAFQGINWGKGHPIGTISSMKGLECGKLDFFPS